MSFEIRTSCLADPCPRCQVQKWLAKSVLGQHATREKAEAVLSQLGSTSRYHRLDVVELRADGWPLCPTCGEDELYTTEAAATGRNPTLDTPLTGCYRCGRKLPEVRA